MSTPSASLCSCSRGRTYELTPTRVIFQLSGRDGTISMAERVIFNSSGKLSVFVQGKSFSAEKSNGPLTFKAITSATGLHTSYAAGKDGGQNNISILSKEMGSRRNNSVFFNLSPDTQQRW